MTPRLRISGRYILVYGVAFAILLPFVWVVLTAFKPQAELLTFPPSILPRTWTVENFVEFFRATDFQRAMFNSALLAFLTTVVAMAVSAPGAYALSRFENRIFNWIARIFIYAYMIPAILLIVPIYKIFFNLGLANNLFAIIPIYVALVMPLTLWTLRSFFAGIPVELEEQAMVDGASRFQAFLRILLPQAVPGMIATGIIAMNIGWSEYLFASTLLTRPETMTISPRLESFMGRGIYAWGWLMAASVAVTVPLMFAAGLIQRRLVEGFGSGAVKG